ncbi:MAG: hypothetical protein FWC40_01620 [Proteobacteria bacterium]|nr:hypothetical protein [Pseudomonadota bacterium]
MRRRAMIFLVMCLSVCGLSAMSCASSYSVPVRAMPAGATFDGLWYTNFGEMRIRQTADGRVSGTFAFRTGGEFEGEVVGGVMKFRWTQPGDFQVGRREVVGRGYLVISDDGLNMAGQWGYGDDYVGGGEWTGEKATEIYRR